MKTMTMYLQQVGRSKILVEDEQPVEFGQTLVILK